ncbi:ATP-binding protein [Desulfitobacterium sp.]|uniref:ATP-binding protein n=1 Tax=Desulfitobacterium sp. TaxID=49981 RepID=UPI002B1F0975|nr:ATP-binding protein [Desulfitobacterium sp.]MEA4900198.1 ATP-binding protein [Desulfitobacterium sp.]
MMPRPRNWSISIKLWASMMILILSVLGGLGIAITWLFGDFYLNQKLNELGNDAREITDQLTSQSSWAERLTTVQNTKLKQGTILVLLNAKGDLITIRGNISTGGVFSNVMPWNGGMGLNGTGVTGASGWWIHPLLPNFYFSQKELQRVLAGETMTIEALPNNNNGQTMLIAATPIGKPAEAVLFLGSTPVPVQETISTFRRIIFYSSLFAVFFATLLSLFFARYVTRPLFILQKAASRMAQGDFQKITGVDSRDEIGELASAFNSMGESLRDHMNWLSQERNLLEGIVEGMSDPVIMLDAGGEVLYTNEPAKILWTESEDEPEDRKRKILGFLREMILQSSEDEQKKDLTLDTQVLQVALASTKARDEAKGYVAVLRDITASLRAEKERRDFMASVTHELRTPLHLIQGYLEAIQDGVIPKEEQAEQIDFVLDEARRLAKLVNELQEMNRLERWKALELSTIDLCEFTEELKYRYQGLAEEKGIELEISSIQGKIVADRDRLLQVFINLLDNACRHTPQGKKIHVQISREEDKIKFVIRDEGEGIPPQALYHIFDRFYRVDKARSRKDGGMGLGLSIVQQIVEAHSGSIKAESKLGVGTQFTIWIPQ